MKAEHKLALGIDDVVQWMDPDVDRRATDYTIREILTKSGKVEDADTVLIIENKVGRTAEVYLAEIH